MHVRFGVGRDVEVHDVRDALDVETASRDVGRDKDVELARLEVVHEALTLCLRNIAVE